MMMINDRDAGEEMQNGDEWGARPRSTPPAPPPRRPALQQHWTDDADREPDQTVAWRRHPPHRARGLGPRWPSSPALDAHAPPTRPTSGPAAAAAEGSPLFLRRVVIAGDEYDDVIDDMYAYGLKRSK